MCRNYIALIWKSRVSYQPIIEIGWSYSQLWDRFTFLFHQHNMKLSLNTYSLFNRYLIFTRRTWRTSLVIPTSRTTLTQITKVHSTRRTFGCMGWSLSCCHVPYSLWSASGWYERCIMQTSIRRSWGTTAPALPLRKWWRGRIKLIKELTEQRRCCWQFCYCFW